MPIVRPLVLAAGFAVAASAIAQSADAPQLERRSLTDLRVERTAVDLASPRGSGFGNAFVTMRDELENFPTDTSFGGMGVSAPATSFTGPPGFVWPLNTLRGQSSGDFVRLIDLSGAPVGGVNGVVNATKALRIRTAAAQPPGGFFAGGSLVFGGQSDEPTLPLEPLPGMNARVSAEHWLSSIDTLYSFDPTANFTGFIVGRMIWGGTCADAPECFDVGLPPGPITHFF
ncbi:MAG: hypothetical protein ACTS27_12510, partial [Phycisphaerales bacterium]